MESKMDLSHLMIRTFLFLYRFDWTQFVRLHPPTPSSLPSSTSWRSPASSPNEPILHVLYVSGLLSKVRIDPDLLFSNILSSLLGIVGGFGRRVLEGWKLYKKKRKHDNQGLNFLLLSDPRERNVPNIFKVQSQSLSSCPRLRLNRNKQA
jgi:hypothetical protein